LLEGDHRVRQAMLSGELSGLVPEREASTPRDGSLVALEVAR